LRGLPLAGLQLPLQALGLLLADLELLLQLLRLLLPGLQLLLQLLRLLLAGLELFLQLLGLLFPGLQALLIVLQLLVAFAQQRLLPAGRLARPRQLAQEQVAVLALLVQGLAHHRGEVPAALDRVGGDLEPHLLRRAAFRNLVDVNR